MLARAGRHAVQTLAIRDCGALSARHTWKKKDGEERVVLQWHGDADLELAASLRAIFVVWAGLSAKGRQAVWEILSNPRIFDKWYSFVHWRCSHVEVSSKCRRNRICTFSPTCQMSVTTLDASCSVLKSFHCPVNVSEATELGVNILLICQLRTAGKALVCLNFKAQRTVKILASAIHGLIHRRITRCTPVVEFVVLKVEVSLRWIVAFGVIKD